jgi:hypothetical protein
VVDQLDKNLTSYLQNPGQLDDYLRQLDDVVKKSS